MSDTINATTEDTREKLEADVWQLAFDWSPDTTAEGNPEYVLRAATMRLLDRQAAITVREYHHHCCQNHVDYDEEYKPAIDNLQAKVDELTAERDRLQHVIETQANSFQKLERELKEATDFAKRVEKAAKNGEPVTLFGVDYWCE